jgi:hypothetical protein
VYRRRLVLHPSLPFLVQYLPVSSTTWRLPPFPPYTRSLFALRNPSCSFESTASSQPLFDLPLAWHPRPCGNSYHRTEVRTTILHSPRPAPPTPLLHQTSNNMHRSKHYPEQPFSSPRCDFHIEQLNRPRLDPEERGLRAMGVFGTNEARSFRCL